MNEDSTGIDARVRAVAEVINRRTGSHMGIDSWLPCAQEVIDRLDGIDPLDRIRAALAPPSPVPDDRDNGRDGR